VATRPLGASFADWMGKPVSAGGLGWGDGTVALGLGAAIACLVTYLAVSGRDVQVATGHDRTGDEGALAAGGLGSPGVIGAGRERLD